MCSKDKKVKYIELLLLQIILLSKIHVGNVFKKHRVCNFVKTNKHLGPFNNNDNISLKIVCQNIEIYVRILNSNTAIWDLVLYSCCDESLILTFENYLM